MTEEQAFKLAYPNLADPSRLARDIQARLEAKGLENLAACYFSFLNAVVILTGVDAVKAAYPQVERWVELDEDEAAEMAYASECEREYGEEVDEHDRVNVSAAP